MGLLQTEAIENYVYSITLALFAANAWWDYGPLSLSFTGTS